MMHQDGQSLEARWLSDPDGSDGLPKKMDCSLLDILLIAGNIM